MLAKKPLRRSERRHIMRGISRGVAILHEENGKFVYRMIGKGIVCDGLAD